MAKYIYEQPNWTDFSWDEKAIHILFGEVKLLQGKLIGSMNALGFSEKEDATLNSLSKEIVKSSEIEGELLNMDQVRSSIARRLGINLGGMVESSRHIDGIVEMMLDATLGYEKQLTHERIFGWHAALFPTGFSGPYSIEVGKYRSGDMQIVSGALGKEKVHYEAIKPEFVQAEMDRFLNWLNEENQLDQVLKAAIAHFWFIIIHPFDDGNGRIARAITELLLSRSEGVNERFYSLSNQLLMHRKEYYHILQKVQHSTGDITEWIVWFLEKLKLAILDSEGLTQKIIEKSAFWKKHEKTPLNERQRFMLNKLLYDFKGKLQTSKWAKMTKTSNDTALRDIKDLMAKGILQQTAEQGRSVNYELIPLTFD